jgi:sec-independent protein translocase protein TatC
MARRLRPVAHEDRLSLVEHLTELRVRLVVAIVAFSAATAVCMWQNHTLLDLLNRPLDATVSHGSKDPLVQGARYDQAVKRFLLQNAAVSRRLALTEEEPRTRAELLALARSGEQAALLAPKVRARRPVTLGVGEPFMETLKVSAYAGLLLSLPLILYELYAFILPAFSKREREVAVPAMVGIPILFVTGVVFGYFTVVPSAIKFLQNFNTDSFDVLVQAQPYYKFVILLLAAMGLLFQIQVFLVAANKLGIVSARMLSKNRRYAVLVIAIVAMVLPGQDPVTMTLLMLPMYVLYELSILVVWLLDRRARRHDAEMEAAVEDADAPSEPERELVTLDQD